MSSYTRNDYDLDLPEDGTYACGLIFMDEASEQASRLAMSLPGIVYACPSQNFYFCCWS
jgi:hypothetical protein